MSDMWLDGRRCSEDLQALRALHYGDGVFRTMLLHDGRLDARALQLDRLRTDAARLDLAVPPDAERWLDVALSGHRQAIVKLLLSRDAQGSRGYAPTGTAARMLLFIDPAPAADPMTWRTGLHVEMSAVALSDQPLLAGIKHLNRLEQVLASRGWAPGQGEALMCDHSGDLIAGTRSNLFVVRADRLQTPALDRCGVAGVTRERVLHVAARLGLSVDVMRLPRAALDTASECFLTNSVFGMRPVGRLGARRLTVPGPLTRRVAAALAHPGVAAGPLTFASRKPIA